MSSAGSKWKLGCGIGCGVILLLVIVVVMSAIFFARHTGRQFETAIETRETLEQRFGRTQAFTPAPDGSIAPARLEVFLAVRDSLQAVRANLAETFAVLQDVEKSGSKTPGSVIRAVKMGLGLAGTVAEFYQTRNQALLDRGMSLGEYTYIYVLAYYVWLGRSPGDGPEDINIEWEENGEGFQVRMGEQERVRVREQHLSQRRICQDLQAMLKNQLAALPESESSEQAQIWRRELTAEITRMQESPTRLPWQDGLPAAMAASLVPYREALEAAYSPATNLFELSRSRKRGLSIQAD
jgi:hypothetical protein